MEDLFPKREGLDMSKLKITAEGSFSITRRRDAERIMYVLRGALKNISTLTITDATSCNGGDTINFALSFAHVHAIELNKENFEALTNNIGAYNFKNVTLHHGDSTKMFNWNTHALYIDPPWGGKDYRQHVKLDLYLSNIRLDLWLGQILMRKNRPNHIILKLPFNYNFDRFNTLVNIDYIKPYQIRSYVLVIMNVRMPKSDFNHK